MNTSTETPTSYTIETKHAPVHVQVGEERRVGHSPNQFRTITEVTFTVIGLDYSETLLSVHGPNTLHRPCGECQGGFRPEYLHIDNGICYRCAGRGISSRLWGGPETAATALARIAYLDRQEEAIRWAETEARRAEDEARAAAAAVEEAYEEHARREAAARSRFLGEVGDKVEFTGKVACAMRVDGYAYGSTQIYLIITGSDEEGPWTAKAYTSAGWAYDVERGDEVTVRATVKGHVTRGSAHERAGERITQVKSPRLVK